VVYIHSTSSRKINFSVYQELLELAYGVSKL